MGTQHKDWNGTGLRCCFSDPKEVSAGCVSVYSNQSNHILSRPGTRSSWVNFASVWIQIFFYSRQTLLTKAFVSSVEGLQKLYQVTPLVCHAVYKSRAFLWRENIFQGFNHFHPDWLVDLQVLLSLHHSASVKKEQDFNKWFLLASTFDNTERCLGSSSENPGMIVSLKTRSFQEH